MKTALIVVDVQKDFCDNGSLPVTGGYDTAAKISDLVATTDKYDVVVATRDWHINPGSHFSDTPDYVSSWPHHCVAGTPGAEFADELVVSPDTVVSKGMYSDAYSGFEGTTTGGGTLSEYLQNNAITHVDVVGLALDYCVKFTALDAVVEGFNTTVLKDLTAAVDPGSSDDVVALLEAAGVTVTVAVSDNHLMKV